MTFQLERAPFIAIATRRDVSAPAGSPICAAIYAPGIPCAAWRGHQDWAASLTYAFLTRTEDGCQWLGRTCLQRHDHRADPQPWQRALANRHFLAGTGLEPGWRQSTRRSYWPLVPLIGLMLQLEPDKGILRGYLRRITRGKRDLTQPQKQTLLKMLRERGSRQRSSWRAERQAHRRILKRRRDLTFRLARLEALELKREDQEAVGSLQAANTRWEYGRMESLSEGQEGLVRALEAQYLSQRQERATTLAGVLSTSSTGAVREGVET